MNTRKRKVVIFICAMSLLIVSCGFGQIFVQTPTPTPTPTMTFTPTMTATPTLTPTPTITPTPNGNTVADPQGGYTIYIPSGYSSYCNKGTCVVTQDDKTLFRGMNFLLSPLKDPVAEESTQLFLDLILVGMLKKFEQVGVFAENRSDPYTTTLGDIEGRALDFTGTDGKPVEGQIVAFLPDPNHLFWAMAWVDTSSDPEIWKNQGKNIFQFILNSVIFTP
jgi:hypothetical protein